MRDMLDGRELISLSDLNVKCACSSKKIQSSDYKRWDDEILGGCVVDDGILWHCEKCKYEWGKNSE